MAILKSLDLERFIFIFILSFVLVSFDGDQIFLLLLLLLLTHVKCLTYSVAREPMLDEWTERAQIFDTLQNPVKFYFSFVVFFFFFFFV